MPSFAVIRFLKIGPNVDFVRVIDEHTIELITYERGVGITAACGTGACASAYIAVRDGKCVSPVAVPFTLWETDC